MEEASYYPELDIPVLVLRGTHYEMGYQRGKLFGDMIKDTFDYYREFPKNVLNLTRLAKVKPLGEMALSAINSAYAIPIMKNFGPYVEAELRGVCEAAGLKYDTMGPPITLPDVMLNIIGLALKAGEAIDTVSKSPLLSAILKGSKNLGCSSIIAWGDATKDTLDGKLVVGRNLDFMGLEHIAHHPLLLLYEPDNGQRYIAATAAGLPTAGITAMNESGITVSLHINFSMDCSSKGMNMINVAQDVVRKAKNLNQAIKIAMAHRPAAGFTMVLTSGDERRAATIEFSAERTVVRYPTGNTMAQTNHYWDEKMKEREARMLSLDLHTQGRLERALDLLEEHYGSITPEKIASFMGDRFDTVAGRERTMGNMLSQPSTMTSVVMVPEDRRIYLAKNPAHKSMSPVSQGRYYGYTLDEMIAGDFSSPREILIGSDFSERKPNEHEAHELFMEAMLDFYNRKDHEFAMDRLSKACEISGNEPFHHYIKGLLEISQGMHTGEETSVTAEKALSSFDQGLAAASGSAYLESFGRFLLARTHLAMDEVEAANVHIRALEDLAEEDISAEELCEKAHNVRKSKKRKFVPGEPDEMILEEVGVI